LFSETPLPPDFGVQKEDSEEDEENEIHEKNEKIYQKDANDVLPSKYNFYKIIP